MSRISFRRRSSLWKHWKRATLAFYARILVHCRYARGGTCGRPVSMSELSISSQPKAFSARPTALPGIRAEAMQDGMVCARPDIVPVGARPRNNLFSRKSRRGRGARIALGRKLQLTSGVFYEPGKLDGE